jgi:hypothetical protein
MDCKTRKILLRSEPVYLPATVSADVQVTAGYVVLNVVNIKIHK